MRALQLLINVLLWMAFIFVGIIFYLGALLIFAVTFPFDPNRRLLQQYACLWSTVYVGLNPFWSVTVDGLEHVDRRKTYVIVSNHQSLADILVIFRTFLHFKWVSKKSMFKVPLLGWNMTLNGYVAIARGDAASREKCMADCRRWLAKGSSVLFFPEGTRSPDGILRPFKPGAFRLAVETGTDILPMVIRGSREAIPKHSLFLDRHAHMHLQVLPPISVAKTAPAQLQEETQRLMREVFEKMQTALGENRRV